MKSSSSLLLCLLLAFAPALSQAGMAEDYCCMCDANCSPPLASRRDKPANTRGETCTQVALQMVDPTRNIRPGTRTCRDWQTQYRDNCCNAYHRPETFAAPKPTSPAEKYGTGNEPSCDLCHSGKMPTKPYTKTAVLNLDYEKPNPTCLDLYWLGKLGNIRDQLCNPLQDFMDVPCGCYDRNPDPNKGGGATAGGAPNQGGGGEGNDPGNGIPPKKDVDSGDASKGDDSKLFQPDGDCRGCVRHLRTKGSAKR